MQTATVLVKADDYRPSEDEEFMNERQLAYFKQNLDHYLGVVAAMLAGSGY